jgi:hypothetical protein
MLVVKVDLRLKRSMSASVQVSVQVFGRRDDGLTTRRGGRRPKSAKARNRVVWGTDSAADAMGIWRRRECW